MVFQNPFATINPRRTIGGWLSTVVRIAARDANRPEMGAGSLRELLLLVGLADSIWDRRPAELSGGECQRAVIAGCLASRAELLILDEPFSMLDPLARDGIISLLQKLRRDFRWSYLVVSHDITSMCRLCEYLLVLDHGRVVEGGPLEKVIKEPHHEATKELLNALNCPLRIVKCV